MDVKPANLVGTQFVRLNNRAPEIGEIILATEYNGSHILRIGVVCRIHNGSHPVQKTAVVRDLVEYVLWGSISGQGHFYVTSPQFANCTFYSINLAWDS